MTALTIWTDWITPWLRWILLTSTDLFRLVINVGIVLTNNKWIRHITTHDETQKCYKDERYHLVILMSNVMTIALKLQYRGLAI